MPDLERELQARGFKSNRTSAVAAHPTVRSMSRHVILSYSVRHPLSCGHSEMLELEPSTSSPQKIR